MKIDKSIGRWEYDKSITYLDDVAYYLYCYPRRRRLKENITSQFSVIRSPKVYKSFYDKAKQYIRKEKINKIKNEKNNRVSGSR